MKILHVAVFTPQSTNVWQADGFEELGHEVIRYDYRAMAKRYGSIGRDDHLMSVCRKESPDFSLFSKCNKMNANVVKKCRKVGKTVLWYMDDVYNMNAELKEKMKYSDYIFCSTNTAVEEGKKYCKNVYRLQGGYDSNIHKPIDVPKIRDVAFIGGMRPYRNKFKAGWDFDVINGVYNEAHSKVVSETKINLSFTEGRGVSNRIYKLMAAGGFVLTMPYDSMYDDFTPGKDFDTFSTPQEMKEKIVYYLEHEEERERIASYGYEAVKQYDHINYAKKILEAVS